MKLLYIYLEEDYKHIPKGGYYFDREFEIEFSIDSKKIDITTNENYHKPFNNTINNISCIVGKNGIGKTTFFEILIAPLLWELDGNMLLEEIHLIFYDEIKEEFFIESYKHNSYEWSVTLDNESINIYKNTFEQFKYQWDKNDKYPMTNDKWSVLPYQMNIIFHSLSPFDRIYTLLQKKLSASPNQRKHYQKRFKYIGVNQIEKNEIKYEYMTIVNLLNLFFNENSKKMMNDLGYFFDNITLDIDKTYFQYNVKIPEYSEFKQNEKEFLDRYYSEEEFNEIKDYILLYLGKYLRDNEYIGIDSLLIDNSLVDKILFKNLKIDTSNKFIYFLKLIINNPSYTEDISLDLKNTIYNRLGEYIEERKLFDSNDYKFLVDLVKNKENFFKLNDLKDEDKLKSIITKGELPELLKNLKKLTAKSIVEFSINLKKSEDNKNSIDFFRLSSGEKTLLSYFANIVGRINELYENQGQDDTYNNVSNKTFLILIDEVELHLHPEWQRSFIKRLNDFFQYEDNSIKLQFIIATHSPFVVSDIYSDNIIYLGEDNKNTKTFGGNIFDIFKDDFYISNTIGAFSEEIIRELSEFLYFLFIFEKAKKENNFFMLRDFFDLMYKTDNRDEDNEELIKKIEYFLNNENEENSENKFKKILENKYYEKYVKDKETFFNEAKKIINNIGEEVVKEHLEKMYLVCRGDL